MKLVSYGDPGLERPGVVERNEIADIGEVRPDWPRTWRGLLEAGLIFEVAEAVDDAKAKNHVVPLGSVRLGPPIVDPSKIVAIGLNYRDHAEEQKKQPPERPLLFAKAPSCLIGPNDPICLPPEEFEDQVDAEAELCLVIGKAVSAVDEAEGGRAIAGYTIMNDVSGRRAQYGDKQWFRGKSFDTFGPCGPWIVTREELADPNNLGIEADWNDATMQRGNTRDLLFGPGALVSYISQQMSLRPGDLITTGTPAGVGVFRDPQIFLKKGDTVQVRVESIGALINPVL